MIPFNSRISHILRLFGYPSTACSLPDCDVSLVRRWDVSKSIEGMLREVRDRERCGGRVVGAVARLFSIPRLASKDSLTITLDRTMVPSFGKQSVWRLLLYEYIVEVEFRSKILGELLVPTVELHKRGFTYENIKRC